MFPRPALETEVLQAVLDELPKRVASLERRRVDEGSAHVVFLIGTHAVIRIARSPNAEAAMRRSQELVDSLPELGIAVPRSLTRVVTVGSTSGCAVEFVPGVPAPAGPAPSARLRRLLDTIQSIPVSAVAGTASPPLAFCGGDRWYEVQQELVLPRLTPALRPRARRTIEALAELAEQRDTVSHGDLAGHNIHWAGGEVVGVVDWDLTSVSDRATDIASLAAWHGFDELAPVVSEGDMIRARVRFDTFPLQQLAFAILADRPGAEVERVMARAKRTLS